MYLTISARYTVDGVKKGGSASDLMDYDTALVTHYGYMNQQIQNADNYKIMSEIRDYDNDFKVVKRDTWTRIIEETTDETEDGEATE